MQKGFILRASSCKLVLSSSSYSWNFLLKAFPRPSIELFIVTFPLVICVRITIFRKKLFSSSEASADTAMPNVEADGNLLSLMESPPSSAFAMDSSGIAFGLNEDSRLIFEVAGLTGSLYKGSATCLVSFGSTL